MHRATEKEIMNVFEELFKEKTTITIAHRLSKIKNADLIIWYKSFLIFF